MTMKNLKLGVKNRYSLSCWMPCWNCGPCHSGNPWLCHRKMLRWEDGFWNLVVNEGLNTLLGRTFDAVGADVNWFVGLQGPNAGTVSTTASNATVTGSGTSFAAADVGSDIIIVGAGSAGADYKSTVATQSSATSLTVAATLPATTVSGQQYGIEPRPADVMATKSFVESTVYSNATRPAWTKNGAPSGGAMSNSSSKASFSINASGRIFGSFLSNNSTKGGTTGLLYGGGLNGSNTARQVENGDTLNVQVDLSVTAVP